MKILVIPLLLLAFNICHAQSNLSVTLVCEGTQKSAMPNCPACSNAFIETSSFSRKVYSFNNSQLVAMNGYPLSSEHKVNCDISEETIRCVRQDKEKVSDVLTINRTSGAVSRAISYETFDGRRGFNFFDGVCKVGTRQF